MVLKDGMFLRVVFTTVVFALAVATSVFFNVACAQDAHTQEGVTSTQASENIDVRAGVWNDGQAALWDLNIIDHYRYFGFPERSRGYQPAQPIHFSHKLHVGENKIECQFCHWSVTKSSFAAIPEEQVCMGCHGNTVYAQPLVNTERAKNSEDLKKLREYYEKGEPIPWNKVHVMPDYVRFNHKRHLKAGVACQECHGQIPEMDVVERVSSMKMGWCIDCHRDRGTSIDCTTCHK
jgi:hypothetical protein